MIFINSYFSKNHSLNQLLVPQLIPYACAQPHHHWFVRHRQLFPPCYDPLAQQSVGKLVSQPSQGRSEGSSGVPLPPPPPCEIIVLSVYNWSSENARIQRINIHENHTWNLFRFQWIKMSNFIYLLPRDVTTPGILKGWQVWIVRNWALLNLANINHPQKILNLVLKKRWDFF